MPKEKAEYVEQLIEDGIGNVKPLWTAYYRRFPSANYAEKANVLAYRTEYLRKRLGTTNFKPQRLRAFQLFDSGETINGVAEKTGVNVELVETYHAVWLVKNSAKRKKKKKRPKYGFRCGSGCVFSAATDRSSIWKKY